MMHEVGTPEKRENLKKPKPSLFTLDKLSRYLFRMTVFIRDGIQIYNASVCRLVLYIVIVLIK